MSKKRRAFTPEYKDEAARMVVESSRPVAQVARELGLNEQTLRNWVNAYREAHADDEPPLSLRSGHGSVRWRKRFGNSV